MAPPRDTSRNAFAVQIERLRKAGPSGRLAMAADMSDAIRDLAAAGVRRRHPEYDDRRVIADLVERQHKRLAPRTRAPSK